MWCIVILVPHRNGFFFSFPTFAHIASFHSPSFISTAALTSSFHHSLFGFLLSYLYKITHIFWTVNHCLLHLLTHLLDIIDSHPTLSYIKDFHVSPFILFFLYPFMLGFPPCHFFPNFYSPHQLHEVQQKYFRHPILALSLSRYTSVIVYIIGLETCITTHITTFQLRSLPLFHLKFLLKL